MPPTSSIEIPSSTTVGAVSLSVADLSRSLAFYAEQIGLGLLRRDDGHAVLGVGDRELLVLHEEPGVVPAGGLVGLFHFALLLPERRDLARWLVHAAQARVRLTGLSDHFVSEAIYLNDPDGHGIEIYADRPRETWEGRVAERMTTLPLDTDDLVGTLDAPPAPYAGMPLGTRMGHVHLRVNNLAAAIRFYADALGMPSMAVLANSAAFFGAGGYHHHIGANVWESRSAHLAPPGTARLLQATVLLPEAEAVERVAAQVEAAGHPGSPTPAGVLVHDPAGIALELRVGH